MDKLDEQLLEFKVEEVIKVVSDLPHHLLKELGQQVLEELTRRDNE